MTLSGFTLVAALAVGLVGYVGHKAVQAIHHHHAAKRPATNAGK